jgi:CBS domain-containing protein
MSPDLAATHVYDWMIASPPVITPLTSVSTALRLLREHALPALPACEDGRVRGLVAETALLRLTPSERCGVRDGGGPSSRAASMDGRPRRSDGSRQPARCSLRTYAGGPSGRQRQTEEEPMMCLGGDIDFMLAKQRIKEWQQEAARARTAAEVEAFERRRWASAGLAKRTRAPVLAWIRARAAEQLSFRIW